MATVTATFMSFNVRFENDEGGIAVRQWANRRDAVCRFIIGSGASVIGFQEVKERQYADLKSGLADRYEMIWFAADPSVSPAGNAFAYDRSIWSLVGDPEIFWLTDTPNVRSCGWGTRHYRNCISAVLEDKKTGVRLRFFVTHLDHRSAESQKKGMDLVLSKVVESQYPSVLCGDFNVERTAEPYRAAARIMMDAQLTAEVSEMGSTFNAWGSKTAGDAYVIDFCFLSKEGVAVKRFEICDDKWGENALEYLSDHYAIRVTVDLTN